MFENSDEHYEIAPNCQQNILIENAGDFRVYKKAGSSSNFCIGKFLSKETLRNIWVFGPAIKINLDSHINISSGRIDIEERKYHLFFFLIFSVLVFNDELAGFYGYNQKADKNKIKLFCTLCLLPLAVVSPLLAVSGIYAIIDEFSLLSILVCLLLFIPIIIVFGLIKSAHSLMRIDDKLKKEQKNLKQVNVFYDNGWFIKFSEKLIK